MARVVKLTKAQSHRYISPYEKFKNQFGDDLARRVAQAHHEVIGIDMLINGLRTECVIHIMITGAIGELSGVPWRPRLEAIAKKHNEKSG